jgi:hypothetical protein
MLLKVTNAVAKDTRMVVKIPFFDELDIPHPVGAVCRRAFVKEQQNYAGIEYVTTEQVHKVFTASELERLPVSMEGFTNSVQNRLVNFVFQRQVDLRKKGLL